MSGRTPHTACGLAVSRHRDCAGPGGGPPEPPALASRSQEGPPGPAAREGGREMSAMKQRDKPVILLLSASDTDLMAARASGGPYRLANPARTSPDAVRGLLHGAFCVIVRLLGGRRSWPGGLAEVVAGGLPVVVLSGEPEPDADLMA